MTIKYLPLAELFWRNLYRALRTEAQHSLFPLFHSGAMDHAMEAKLFFNTYNRLPLSLFFAPGKGIAL